MSKKIILQQLKVDLTAFKQLVKEDKTILKYLPKDLIEAIKKATLLTKETKGESPTGDELYELFKKMAKLNEAMKNYPTYLPLGNKQSEQLLQDFDKKLSAYKKILDKARKALEEEIDEIKSSTAYENDSETWDGIIQSNTSSFNLYFSLYNNYKVILEDKQKVQEKLTQSFFQETPILDFGQPSPPRSQKDLPYEKIDFPLYTEGEEDLCLIDTNDVVQSGGGNCTVIAALADLAIKQPKLIRNAIESRGTIKKGDVEIREFLITLYLSEEGKVPKKIKLLTTDEFYTDGSNKNIFVGKGDNELWPMLIEKAVVSLFGGYTMFEEYGNNLDTIMTVLTGKISKEEEVGLIDNFEDWLQQSKNKIITAAMGKHAYSVKNVDFDKKTITTVDSEALREQTFTFSLFQKSFSTIAVSDLSFDSDCPEDLTQEVKLKSNNDSLFSKMDKWSQAPLLEASCVMLRDSEKLYSIISVAANKVVLSTNKNKLELTFEELNQMGLKIVIDPNEINSCILELQSVAWVDRTGNIFTDLYFNDYTKSYGLSGLSESLELTLDEFYKQFDILKK